MGKCQEGGEDRGKEGRDGKQEESGYSMVEGGESDSGKYVYRAYGIRAQGVTR